MNTLNPGYKFLTLLLVSLILSFCYSVRLNFAVFCLCLLSALLTPAVNKKRLLLGLLPFLLAAAGLFFSGLWFPASGEAVTGSWGVAAMTVSSLSGALQLSSRALAFGGIGLLFSLTTRSSEFIMSLMQQFRLPPEFAYGLLAAYHFLPVMRDEYSVVRAALKVRGVRAGPLSGKTLLPMLVHALRRSESVAMAMESRGFYPKAPRGVAFLIPAGTKDFAFLFLAVSGTLAGAFLL